MPVAFLWVSMALFDDEAEPDTATVYRPVHFDLYTVADARDRFLRLLAEAPRWEELDRFLPDVPEQADHGARRFATAVGLVQHVHG
jgi:hypothetical protein